jgi:hypothetical protein
MAEQQVVDDAFARAASLEERLRAAVAEATVANERVQAAAAGAVFSEEGPGLALIVQDAAKEAASAQAAADAANSCFEAFGPLVLLGGELQDVMMSAAMSATVAESQAAKAAEGAARLARAAEVESAWRLAWQRLGAVETGNLANLRNALGDTVMQLIALDRVRDIVEAAMDQLRQLGDRLAALVTAPGERRLEAAEAMVEAALAEIADLDDQLARACTRLSADSLSREKLDEITNAFTGMAADDRATILAELAARVSKLASDFGDADGAGFDPLTKEYEANAAAFEEECRDATSDDQLDRLLLDHARVSDDIVRRMYRFVSGGKVTVNIRTVVDQVLDVERSFGGVRRPFRQVRQKTVIRSTDMLPEELVGAAAREAAWAALCAQEEAGKDAFVAATAALEATAARLIGDGCWLAQPIAGKLSELAAAADERRDFASRLPAVTALAGELEALDPVSVGVDLRAAIERSAAEFNDFFNQQLSQVFTPASAEVQPADWVSAFAQMTEEERSANWGPLQGPLAAALALADEASGLVRDPQAAIGDLLGAAALLNESRTLLADIGSTASIGGRDFAAAWQDLRAEISGLLADDDLATYRAAGRTQSTERFEAQSARLICDFPSRVWRGMVMLRDDILADVAEAKDYTRWHNGTVESVAALREEMQALDRIVGRKIRFLFIPLGRKYAGRLLDDLLALEAKLAIDHSDDGTAWCDAALSDLRRSLTALLAAGADAVVRDHRDNVKMKRAAKRADRRRPRDECPAPVEEMPAGPQPTPFFRLCEAWEAAVSEVAAGRVAKLAAAIREATDKSPDNLDEGEMQGCMEDIELILQPLLDSIAPLKETSAGLASDDRRKSRSAIETANAILFGLHDRLVDDPWVRALRDNPFGVGDPLAGLTDLVDELIDEVRFASRWQGGA